MVADKHKFGNGNVFCLIAHGCVRLLTDQSVTRNGWEKVSGMVEIHTAKVHCYGSEFTRQSTIDR